jgi:hypothetical protein
MLCDANVGDLRNDDIALQRRGITVHSSVSLCLMLRMQRAHMHYFLVTLGNTRPRYSATYASLHPDYPTLKPFIRDLRQTARFCSLKQAASPVLGSVRVLSFSSSSCHTDILAPSPKGVPLSHQPSVNVFELLYNTPNLVIANARTLLTSRAACANWIADTTPCASNPAPPKPTTAAAATAKEPSFFIYVLLLPVRWMTWLRCTFKRL